METTSLFIQKEAELLPGTMSHVTVSDAGKIQARRGGARMLI
jgi:hypothetical protein